MSDESLAAALQGLRVRVPVSAADAADLRAEVRAADAALGAWLRTATTERLAQRDRHDDGGER
ncbi:hypothetical protein LTA6_000684 [Microbacterium sp. LTA6]|uniref:hypothetical protein n=1 Tax=unclassified Microbacterium TaxID=2609290 RepID=UPI003138BD2F